MDNALLEQLLHDGRSRSFWFKPIGIPGTLPGERETFGEERVRIDFAKEPSAVEIDDVLFVYRIGVSKLLYIAECLTPPHEATPAEIEREEWRGRWRWYLGARNLTPEYGSVWSRHNLKPFRLADEYNANDPVLPQSLNGIKLGLGKLRVVRPFAQFVMDKVAGLERTATETISDNGRAPDRLSRHLP